MQPFTIPELRPIPQIVTPATVPPGNGRRLLLVVAHADDPAFFAGGVLALWARAGWEVHALRITDDRWDSVGLDEAETIRLNALEFRAAAKVLGLHAVENLGLQTDVLGDYSRVRLRERIIHTIRRLRPFGLVSFDPSAQFYEDNLDHKVLAEAVDEAFWTSMFDKHHPEHFAEGLSPHGCVERWYFGRTITSVTHVFDISTTIDAQMQAIACHETPLANMAHQFALQAATAGWSKQRIADAIGDTASRLRQRLTNAAQVKGRPFGLDAAEYMRCHAVRLEDGPADSNTGDHRRTS